MLERLGELNQELTKIRIKRKKKCQKQYLRCKYFL